MSETDSASQCATWSRESPTEAGFYWCFSHTGYWRNTRMRLTLVEVRVTLSGPQYIMNGMYVKRDHVRDAFWQPAAVPELPVDY